MWSVVLLLGLTEAASYVAGSGAAVVDEKSGTSLVLMFVLLLHSVEMQFASLCLNGMDHSRARARSVPNSPLYLACFRPFAFRPARVAMDPITTNFPRVCARYRLSP